MRSEHRIPRNTGLFYLGVSTENTPVKDAVFVPFEEELVAIDGRSVVSLSSGVLIYSGFGLNMVNFVF